MLLKSLWVDRALPEVEDLLKANAVDAIFTFPSQAEKLLLLHKGRHIIHPNCKLSVRTMPGPRLHIGTHRQAVGSCFVYRGSSPKDKDFVE